MMQDDAELFQAYGAEFAPDYRREHWAQGPVAGVHSGAAPSAVPLPASASTGSVGAPAPYHPPSSTVPLPASGPTSNKASAPAASSSGHGSHGGHAGHGGHSEGDRLPAVAGMTRNHGREVWQGGTWVANTTWEPGRWHEGDFRTGPDGFRLIFRRGDWVRADEVSQIVIFSDGSFRVYYLDGHWRQGRAGDSYPVGYPVFHDVATLPVGPRFSFFISGIDAYRLDNVTGHRFRLGQYMPDGRVLVGSILYHPRYDGSLEWVGPTNVGQNPQADANLKSLEDTVKKEGKDLKRAAAIAASAEQASRRGRRPVLGVPAPVVNVTNLALPQAIGTVPAYVIAASASPSLEDIADVAAEAGYEGAQLALDEAAAESEVFTDPTVLVEEFDIFGDDPTGGLGFDYRDPRAG